MSWRRWANDAPFVSIGMKLIGYLGLKISLCVESSSLLKKIIVVRLSHSSSLVMSVATLYFSSKASVTKLPNDSFGATSTIPLAGMN